MNDSTFIPTKAALLKRKSAEEFKEITFTTPKPKGASKKSEKHAEKEGLKEKVNEFDIKKTRHEVLKFGMSGFDPSKKEEVKMQLAIKLGAKPPKNKYKNYKQLLEEKKRAKEKEEKLKSLQQLGKNSMGKSTAKGKRFDKKKPKKKKDGILDIYGKVKAPIPSK